MFVLFSQWYNRFFPEATKRAVRRRQVRYAEYAARQRQERSVRPRLEALEDRELLDAYGFQTLAGAPNSGSYTTAALWTDFTTLVQGRSVPGAGDTALIPTGAVCTLDNGSGDQALSALTVNGTMTIKSVLNVQPGGANPGGNGTTAVSGGGSLTVATPDIPGTSSRLETFALTTAGSAGTNLTIGDSATVEVDSSATLAGTTVITGLFDAKNIDAFTGATVGLLGPGTVSGAGQLEAGINATITFASGSSWSILAGNPVGSALKAGDFHVDGPLSVDTHLNPDANIYLDPGGSIVGTGDLDVVSELFWLGGTLGPANGTVIDSSGELQGSSGSMKTLATDLTNESAFSTLGGAGGLTINSGVTFDDAAGTVGVSLSAISGSGLFQVDGLGTLDFQSLASAPTTISSNFINNGVVQVSTGAAGKLMAIPSGGTTIALDGVYQLDGDLTLLGTISSPTGFVERSGGGKLIIGNGMMPTTLTLGSGETTVLDGNVEVSDHGTLTGSGAWDNNGLLLLDLGSSTLGLGAYQQSSTATLEEQANGPGTNSTLSVSGAAQLSGTLKLDFVGGYTPQSGDKFTVVTAGSIGAHFDTTPADMTVDYGPGGVTLTQN